MMIMTTTTTTTTVPLFLKLNMQFILVLFLFNRITAELFSFLFFFLLPILHVKLLNLRPKRGRWRLGTEFIILRILAD